MAPYGNMTQARGTALELLKTTDIDCAFQGSAWFNDGDSVEGRFTSTE